MFGGTEDNFRAARMAATIAITACLRFGCTTPQYHFRFVFAIAKAAEQASRTRDGIGRWRNHG
jgi:hypothetical protein